MWRWVKAFALAAAFWAAGPAGPSATAGPAPDEPAKVDKGLLASPVQQAAPSSAKAPGNAAGQSAQRPSGPTPVDRDVVIMKITPPAAYSGALATIEFSPAIDPVNSVFTVLFGDNEAKVIGQSAGVLDVVVPSLGVRADGETVPVRIQGGVYTKRPYMGFAYPSAAKAPAKPFLTLQNLAAALAALAAAAVAAWAIWNQRRREQGLKAEMFRMEERLRQAETPVSISMGGHEPLQPQHDPAPEEPSPGAAEAEPSPPPEPPDELVQAIAGGGAILYLGSGVSAQAGLPTWSQFIDGFLRGLERDEPQADWGAVRVQFNRRAVRVVADLIESRGKGQRLAQAVRQTYGGPVQAPPWLSRFVARTPFAGVLTTNFDHVADRATEAKKPRVLGPTSNVDFGALLRENNFFLMKLHGDPSETPGAAFAVEYLWRALEERPDLRGFLGTLFASRTMFFAGVDPGSIEGFLTAIGARAGSIRHFALVPEEADSAVLAESFRGRFNLDLVPFRPSEGFPQLEDFFDLLGQRVAAVEAAQPALDGDSKVKTTPMQISRVRLVNIGPFTDASFDFSPRWTVLLGDNGCGKSTVLRAVALALCGSETEAGRQAHSLLRQSKDVQSGMIELTMASSPPTTYTVELRRTREGVSVSTSAFGPLQSGTMVALGFPALRGVVPGQAAAAPEGANYPRVQDVIPLIRGGIDARVSNLKGWIRDNYTSSQDTHLTEAQRARYGAMLHKLFQLIDDMIPGFEVRLSRYDSVTKEVLLKTPDGELPLDYVSQGMSSTVGWLGVLVQRIYEIYPRTNEPEQEHALLLIDEMDSHLHPEWQRVLAPNIKKHFPNVQVIATTHSPLVVANMEAGEVIRVVRSGREIEVQHLKRSFSGYRADQVLTADAFGLASARGVGWEDKRKAYAALLAKTDRTPDEQATMEGLGRELEDTSFTQETEVEHVATAAVRDALERQVKDLDWGDARKQAALREAADYLAKLSGGAAVTSGTVVSGGAASNAPAAEEATGRTVT